MDGNTVIAKILKLEGVEWMACFPHQNLIDAAAKEGIRPIISRQERAGVNIADGFSRIHNGKKNGVFAMQLGPGAENAFGGVAQGFADSVPMLLLPGGLERRRIGVAPGFDAVEHYKGITKWSGHVNLVDRIPEMMRRAFSYMRHGRRGPVLLEVPEDVATEEFPTKDIDYIPVKEHKSKADNDDIRDLITALLKASRPIINAGQGILYGEATDELVEFAELTNTPVLTTLAGKSAFPENHRLALGTGAHSATLMVDHFLGKADFVLGIGTSFTMSTFNAPMPKGVVLAHSTNCAEDINKDYKAHYGAVGDSRLILRQMIAEVKKQLGDNGQKDVDKVSEEIGRVRGEFMKEWGPRLDSSETPISPYRVIGELIKAVDLANTIITHDSGFPRDQLVPFWPALRPRSYIGWGKSTQLGYGLGLVMGAKMAAPDKTVINVMGDAAFGMCGLDIETAVRSNIGICTVILNNSVMTHYSSHMPFASDQYGSNKLSGEYAKVADGLGAYAQRITSPDHLALAIQSAVEHASKGQPSVIEVITKEEPSIPKFW